MAEVASQIFSPISESLYPMLAVLLLTVGLVLTASFFIYEVTTSKFSRSLTRELTTGGVASVFMAEYFTKSWASLLVPTAVIPGKGWSEVASLIGHSFDYKIMFLLRIW